MGKTEIKVKYTITHITETQKKLRQKPSLIGAGVDHCVETQEKTQLIRELELVAAKNTEVSWKRRGEPFNSKRTQSQTQKKSTSQRQKCRSEPATDENAKEVNQSKTKTQKSESAADECVRGLYDRVPQRPRQSKTSVVSCVE